MCGVGVNSPNLFLEVKLVQIKVNFTVCSSKIVLSVPTL